MKPGAQIMLMAILCGSYETEAAALSKLNPARKILARVSQAILHDARVQTDTNGLFDSTEAPLLRK